MSRHMLAAVAIVLAAGTLKAADPATQKPPQYALNVLLTECAVDVKEKTLANPTLSVQDGQRAYFTVGGEVPFKSADGTIKYKPFGAMIKLTPKRLKDGKLNLGVEFEHSVVKSADPLHLNCNRMETLIEDVEAKGVEVKLDKAGSPGVTLRLRVEAEEVAPR